MNIAITVSTLRIRILEIDARYGCSEPAEGNVRQGDPKCPIPSPTQKQEHIGRNRIRLFPLRGRRSTRQAAEAKA